MPQIKLPDGLTKLFAVWLTKKSEEFLTETIKMSFVDHKIRFKPQMLFVVKNLTTILHIELQDHKYRMWLTNFVKVKTNILCSFQESKTKTPQCRTNINFPTNHKVEKS